MIVLMINLNLLTEPVAIFFQDALKKMPPLRPLCLILKVFLQQRELNEVFSASQLMTNFIYLDFGSIKSIMSNATVFSFFTYL